MIAGIGSKMEVNLEIKTGPSSRPKEPGFRESRFGKPEIVNTNILIGLLFFMVVLLFCIMVLLEIKSLSGLLETAKPY